jgi:hypothetical protein
MITWYLISLDEREHAIITALEVEHTHGTHDFDATQIVVQTDIPDEVVISDVITIGRYGDLTGSKSYPRLRTLNDGTPRTEGGRYHDGSAIGYPVRLDLKQLDLRDRIEEVVRGRIVTGQICTGVVSYVSEILPRIAADQAEIDSAATAIVAEETRQAAAIEQYARERAERDEVEHLKAELAAAREAEERAQKNAESAKRAAWIEQHGSDHLRLGNDKGYACRKQFAQEWGTVELGAEYVLDFASKISTGNRSCPSEDALREQVRIEMMNLPDTEVRVCWLPKNLDELDDDYTDGYNEPAPVEAVEVQAHGVYYYRVYRP